MDSSTDYISKLIKQELEEIGLRNFSVDISEDHLQAKIVARLGYIKEISPEDIQEGDYWGIILDILGDHRNAIENSPHIAFLKARHADEVSDLHDRIKELQEQNMKLSGTIEYLDSKLAAKNAADEQE